MNWVSQFCNAIKSGLKKQNENRLIKLFEPNKKKKKKNRELSKKKKATKKGDERKKERKKNFDTEGDDDDDDDDVRTITLNSTLLHARKEHVTHAGAALAAKIDAALEN